MSTDQKRRTLKFILLVIMVSLIAGFYYLAGDNPLTFEGIKQQQSELQILYRDHSGIFVASLFLIYVIATAFSLPAATLLTLLSGATLGFVNGLLLASFASSIGATLAFLMARFIFGEKLKTKFSEQLPQFHQGFKDEGAFYLFALRLTPVFPFFMVNLLMGLLPITTWRFYWVSQVGMLAGAAVFVYAGTQIAKIEQLSDIASPTLFIAFTLLGLLPLFSKKLLHALRKNTPQIRLKKNT